MLFGAQSFASNISIQHKKNIKLVMPEESDPHRRTWMAFVANDYIWSTKQIPQVKKDLIHVADTIAKYEPVAMLVNKHEYQEAAGMLRSLEKRRYSIELIPFPIDDLWLRDIGPTFVRNNKGEKVGIDFNFNGWGNKQEHKKDEKVAAFITKRVGAILQKSRLTLEGGCFEVDGHGSAIISKSCVLNDNRNPAYSQDEIENELKELLGLRKIIWLEGIKGKDITDGHTDFYARFVRKGVVAVSRENDPDFFDYQVTRENIAILRRSTDADGISLKLLILDTPSIVNEDFGIRDFAAGYIGYYVCNGAIIMQKFGDEFADLQAKKVLEEAFPSRVVEQISIDGIASGGGSVHCATQQEI